MQALRSELKELPRRGREPARRDRGDAPRQALRTPTIGPSHESQLSSTLSAPRRARRQSQLCAVAGRREETRHLPARPGKGKGRVEARVAPRLGGGRRAAHQERARARARDLARAQKDTLDAVSGLSDAQWSFKPAADKWSVGECVEHLLLIEEKRTPALESQLKEKPEEGWATKTIANTELLETALVNRSFKVKALEEFTPAGKLARADALERYKKARAQDGGACLEARGAVQVTLRAAPVLRRAEWLPSRPRHRLAPTCGTTNKSPR